MAMTTSPIMALLLSLERRISGFRLVRDRLGVLWAFEMGINSFMAFSPPAFPWPVSLWMAV